MPEITTDITATVNKVVCSPGETVAAGDAVVVLESMKMEIPLESDVGGVVREVRVTEGSIVSEGDVLVVLE